MTASIALVALAGALMSAPPQDLAPGSPEAAPVESIGSVGKSDSLWTIELGLHLWVATTTGDVRVGGRSVDVDTEFGDWSESRDGGVHLWGELWNDDRIGILVNLDGTQFKAEIEGAQAGEVEHSLLMLEIAAAYRFGGGSFAFDVLGGIRGSALESEIETVGLPEVEEETRRIEAMVGVRCVWEPIDWLSLSARVDAGGFGTGSDLSGQAILLALIRVSGQFTLQLGYRAVVTEVEKSDYEVETVMHGPVFGCGFSW